MHRDLLAVPLAHRLQCDPGAQALHIHKQTLGYRIRKIEQLTGFTCTNATAKADLKNYGFAVLPAGTAPGDCGSAS